MASRIGQVLRDARTERGIALSEVERVTKIRTKFLQAMEEERWDELPAPVYARGFLEIYARFLGLDDGPLVEEYRRTVEGAERSEPIPAAVLQPGVLGRRRRSRIRPLVLPLAGLAAAAALGVAIVALAGSDGGDGAADRREETAPESADATAPGQDGTAPADVPSAPPSEVSLELRAAGTVWVCLLDDRDRARVNGETLIPGQIRGPFAAHAFEVTFGNGSVEMTVDGEPAEIPALAEPLGYRITASGVRELDPASQPTCS